MRDTSVTETDLAIESAKQKLATLKERPGYREAMRKEPHDKTTRIICVVAAAACAGIIYACTLYITAAWLRWFFMIIFGGLGLVCLFATIGLSPKLAAEACGAAILDKRIADDKHLIDFLRENGDRTSLDVSESTYALLQPGDLGVLKYTGSAPDYSFDSFQRL